MSRFENPVPQFLLDNGDPAPLGKLYFFSSGTNTPLVTFKDVNLSLPNAHPVELSASGRTPNIFFNETAKVVFTDSDDVQIFERDPVGETGVVGNFSLYNSLTIYDSGDIVTATFLPPAATLILAPDILAPETLSCGLD